MNFGDEEKDRLVKEYLTNKFSEDRPLGLEGIQSGLAAVGAAFSNKDPVAAAQGYWKDSNAQGQQSQADAVKNYLLQKDLAKKSEKEARDYDFRERELKQKAAENALNRETRQADRQLLLTNCHTK